MSAQEKIEKYFNTKWNFVDFFYAYCASNGIDDPEEDLTEEEYSRLENENDMELKEYAKKILTDHGCDEYTYGGESSKYVLRDLKEEYPNGMEYPYVDVANAILELSRPKPIYRSPWKMIYNADCGMGGIDCETFDAAKNDAIDMLIMWQIEQVAAGYPIDINNWSDDEIDGWDYMYYNYDVWVEKYNPNTDEYEEYWHPSNEDLKKIWWMEYEDLKKIRKGE